MAKDERYWGDLDQRKTALTLDNRRPTLPTPTPSLLAPPVKSVASARVEGHRIGWTYPIALTAPETSITAGGVLFPPPLRVAFPQPWMALGVEGGDSSWPSEGCDGRERLMQMERLKENLRG